MHDDLLLKAFSEAQNMNSDDHREKFLVTAGGRITCLRCLALSGRSKQQCRKPALKVSRTQKCGFHGGGPKKVHMKHGLETVAARAERSRDSAVLSVLEDALHLMGLSDDPRTPGRKAKGYKRLKTRADLRQFVLGAE